MDHKMAKKILLLIVLIILSEYALIELVIPYQGIFLGWFPETRIALIIGASLPYLLFSLLAGTLIGYFMHTRLFMWATIYALIIFLVLYNSMSIGFAPYADLYDYLYVYMPYITMVVGFVAVVVWVGTRRGRIEPPSV